jgi:lipopolysaccharide transport system ATP-binding protein
MSDVVVHAEGVGKQYRLGQLTGGYRLLSETISDRFRSLGRRDGPREEFWALRDVGFEIERGETFGIVGHNGAGKSTLLKILSRVTPPTEGEVHLRGRVGALLEVGTGFHQELTGRENIFLNGAILGMRRAEIERKFDEIVDFAEVERFIDTPVKRYSSGMYLRLAFAVAAHLEPEVLIVDEVLSVGDLSFQEKCLGRMERVAGEGRTVIFVSHNLTAVSKLCNRAMLLDHGAKVTEGATDAVIESYIRSVSRQAGVSLDERHDREGDGRLRFRDISFASAGEVSDIAVTGRDFEVRLAYETAEGRPVGDANFAVAIYTLLGTLILHCQSEVSGSTFRELPPSGTVRCVIPRCPLPAGRYTVNVFATAGGQIADWVQRASELTVAEGDFYGTGRRPSAGHQSVLVDHSWLGPLDQAEPVEQVPSRMPNRSK